MLLYLPPLDGRDGPRAKNGPALTGHGAEAVRDAIVDAIGTLAVPMPSSSLDREGWLEEIEQFAQEQIGPHTAQVGIPTPLEISFHEVHNYLAAG
jgi:hypothetical protein